MKSLATQRENKFLDLLMSWPILKMWELRKGEYSSLQLIRRIGIPAAHTQYVNILLGSFKSVFRTNRNTVELFFNFFKEREKVEASEYKTYTISRFHRKCMAEKVYRGTSLNMTYDFLLIESIYRQNLMADFGLINPTITDSKLKETFEKATSEAEGEEEVSTYHSIKEPEEEYSSPIENSPVVELSQLNLEKALEHFSEINPSLGVILNTLKNAGARVSMTLHIEL